MGGEPVVVPKVGLPAEQPEKGGIPAIVVAAMFAWDECFSAEIPNAKTRTAYPRNARAFLVWCQERGVELGRVTPGMVGQYLEKLEIRPSVKASPSTKKQSLAAIPKFFDKLVLRHAILLNPAASVRTEKYAVIEGKTPEIGVEQARKLLRSINVDTVVGLRDRAAIAIMNYTAARVGAVAKLTMKNFDHDGTLGRFASRRRGASPEKSQSATISSSSFLDTSMRLGSKSSTRIPRSSSRPFVGRRF
jgi:integrase/recombinase XerD